MPEKYRPTATDTRSNDDLNDFEEGEEKILSGFYFYGLKKRVREINGEIKGLTEQNNEFSKQIEALL